MIQIDVNSLFNDLLPSMVLVIFAIIKTYNTTRKAYKPNTFRTYIFKILMALILLKRFGQLAKNQPSHMEKYVNCHVYKYSYSDYILSQLNPVNDFTPIFL